MELNSEGTHSTDLDGFFVGSEEDINQIKILPRKLSLSPKLKQEKQNRILS